MKKSQRSSEWHEAEGGRGKVEGGRWKKNERQE
jgi:hypothetical protein